MHAWFARLSQRPVLAGGLVGLTAFVVGNILLTLLVGTPPQDEPLAGDGLFATNKLWLIACVGAVWAPVFETVVAQWLPIELLRRIGAPSVVCLLASAALFSGGHMLGGGGVLQGAVTFVFGLVLAAVYLHFRAKGPGAAFAAAWACHCVNNSLAIAGMALGF
jgi:membrane protease YdiL (CAAX protease family)